MNSISIKDPILEPFHIVQDNYNFTVFETIVNEGKRRGRKSKSENLGKKYERQINYHATLGGAIKAVMKLKMLKNEKYTSLNEYLNEYKKIETTLKSLTEKI